MHLKNETGAQVSQTEKGTKLKIKYHFSYIIVNLWQEFSTIVQTTYYLNMTSLHLHSMVTEPSSFHTCLILYIIIKSYILIRNIYVYKLKHTYAIQFLLRLDDFIPGPVQYVTQVQSRTWLL